MQNQARLKIWVGEYISAGGMVNTPLPDSLLHEGQWMRDALIADLVAAGFDCITSLDARVAKPASQLPYITLQPQDDPWQCWQQQWRAAKVDAVWMIAPETDNVLADCAKRVNQLGLQWLGCRLDAIHTCTSKAATADYFAKHGINTIAHVLLRGNQPITALPVPAQQWVIKPDDGAGCCDTYLVDQTHLATRLNDLGKALPDIHWLVQPYVAGEALSLSVIASTKRAQVIAVNTQQIAVIDQQFHYRGAGVHAAHHYLPRMQRFAEQLHAALPGLVGFWGADIILTPQGECYLVEINPRLTTPYIAMVDLLSQNPAQLIVDALIADNLPKVTARHALKLSLDLAPCKQQ